MEQMTFEQFKKDCIRACHVRHSCEEGLHGVVSSENTLQLLAVVKTFWKDVYESKYFDITSERIQEWYKLKQDFNRQGIYVNEPARKGIVMVNNYDGNFSCGGEADIYLFGKDDVTALDYARVHNRTSESHIVLFNSSYGYIDDGDVEIHGYANAEIRKCGKADCYGSCTVRIYDGTLTDHGHKRIYAFGDSIVVSDNPTGIILYDRAKIISPRTFILHS